jgi:choline dehydrogenase-like flavoprotein
MQSVFFPIGMHKAFADDISIFYGIKKASLEEYIRPYVGRDSSWILLNVARPKSSGFVRLQSSDPADHPLIDPKYFEDPEDMKSMVEGM